MSEMVIYDKPTAADAAARVGLTLDEVVDLIRNGTLFGLFTAGRWYVSDSSIEILEGIAARRQERRRRKMAAGTLKVL